MPERNDAEEKSQPATPRALEKAREKGQIARSQELTGSLLLLGGAVLLIFLGGNLWRGMEDGLRQAIQGLNSGSLGVTDANRYLRSLLHNSVLLALPILLLAIGVSLASGLLQSGGVRFTPSALAWKVERLHPAQNLQKMASLKSVMKTAAALARLLVVVGLMAGLAWWQAGDVMRLSGLPLVLALHEGVRVVLHTFAWLASALVILGLIDYAYQRWQWHRDLRMSHQQIREETKQAEGDPLVKQAVRARQRQIQDRPLSTIVAEAAVVITNPTHVAVALAYEQGQHNAPTVTAKGMEQVAQQIKSLARDASVPVIEQPPLARALFRDVQVGETIPEPLYEAVAEVLALVYRLRQQRAGGRT